MQNVQRLTFIRLPFVFKTFTLSVFEWLLKSVIIILSVNRVCFRMMKFLLILACVVASEVTSQEYREPRCHSQFDYEYRVCQTNTHREYKGLGSLIGLWP